MKINIIAVGNLKDKHWTLAQADYLKKIGRFCDISVTEIAEEPVKDDMSKSEISSLLEKEGAKILKSAEKSIKVVLTPEAKSFTSEQFSEKLGALLDTGKPLCFIIGSSYGLSEDVKKSADLCLSLSELTFAHRLARIVLLEQIFRGFKILRGQTYHK